MKTCVKRENEKAGPTQNCEKRVVDIESPRALNIFRVKHRLTYIRYTYFKGFSLLHVLPCFHLLSFQAIYFLLCKCFSSNKQEVFNFDNNNKHSPSVSIHEVNFTSASIIILMVRFVDI